MDFFFEVHGGALRKYNPTLVFVAGACDREGVSYQRVHVDDGSETVGVMDYLVHQTVPLHVHLGGCLSCLNEGIN